MGIYLQLLHCDGDARRETGVVMMQWSSEWAEQHYDVSSTTSPPVHPKPRPFLQPVRPGFSGYTDDISALSASSLLKRYAERYSFSSAVQEHGSFLRSEQQQEAWPVGYSAEVSSGLDALKATLGSGGDHTEQHYSSGPSPPEYPSSYSSQPLLPKPSYFSSPAFALPPAYLPPTPGYSYPQPCSLTAGYPHGTPSLLPSGLHTPTPVNAATLHSSAEPTGNRKFGFDQSKTARVSPYLIRDKSDRQGGDGGNVHENCGTDIQSYRPERVSAHSDVAGKNGNLQSLETRSYGSSGQYTYP